MTTGNVLYLLMCLAMFGAFAAALACESWLEGKTERAPKAALAPEPAKARAAMT